MFSVGYIMPPFPWDVKFTLGKSFADYYVSILPTEAAINRVAGGTEGRLSGSGEQRPLAALVHQPIMYGIADLTLYLKQCVRISTGDGVWQAD